MSTIDEAPPRRPLQVAVTGASGFVGSELVQELARRACGVRTLNRAALSDPGAGEAQAALRGAHAVIHLAARAHVLDETSDALLEVYRATNRDLTLALARAAGAAGVRRFVFVSSIRVNGSFTTRPFRPTDPPAPDEPYAISKHEAELGLQAIARATGLEVVIVRPPLVYGPGVKANFLRLLRLASTGVPLPLGSISGKRSLVSIWNLCDLLVRCAGLPAAANRTFLAGDGEDVTLPALIRTLAAGMKRPCRVFPAPPRLVRLLAVAFGQGATFDKLTASLQVDVSETRRVLDWTPPVPLAQGLARTAEWYTRAVLHRGAQAPA